MMMNVQRYLLLVTVALVGTLAGCLGGSGSSGFDITENAAIQEAINTQECQDFEGLVICPAETRPTPAASPTATATITLSRPTATPPAIDTPATPDGTPSNETVTPTSVPATPTRTVGPNTPMQATPTTPVPMQVVTNLTESSDIVCAGGEGSACSFAFFFVASGFPSSAAYRTAAREGENQEWTISEPVAVATEPNQAAFRSEVEFETPANGPAGSDATIQFAVLVFLTEPEGLPSTVARLGDTGANFAYVLPGVPISQ